MDDDPEYEAFITDDDHEVRSRTKDTTNKSFENLAAALNLTSTELLYVLTTDYLSIDNSTKHVLKAALCERCMLSTKSLAPNHFEDLIDYFISTEYKNRNDDVDERKAVWVKSISDIFPSLNKSEKIMILSVFAYTDSMKHLIEKLNCSQCAIRAARVHPCDVGAAMQHKKERIVRHRLSPQLV